MRYSLSETTASHSEKVRDSSEHPTAGTGSVPSDSENVRESSKPQTRSATGSLPSTSQSENVRDSSKPQTRSATGSLPSAAGPSTVDEMTEEEELDSKQFYISFCKLDNNFIALILYSHYIHFSETFTVALIMSQVHILARQAVTSWGGFNMRPTFDDVLKAIEGLPSRAKKLSGVSIHQEQFLRYSYNKRKLPKLFCTVFVKQINNKTFSS